MSNHNWKGTEQDKVNMCQLCLIQCCVSLKSCLRILCVPRGHWDIIGRARVIRCRGLAVKGFWKHPFFFFFTTLFFYGSTEWHGYVSHKTVREIIIQLYFSVEISFNILFMFWIIITDVNIAVRPLHHYDIRKKARERKGNLILKKQALCLRVLLVVEKSTWLNLKSLQWE